jgi:hypothetical protein
MLLIFPYLHSQHIILRRHISLTNPPSSPLSLPLPLPPILKVTTKGKNGGENYLYDQVAMDTFMKTLPENANPSIQRFKGLGPCSVID